MNKVQLTHREATDFAARQTAANSTCILHRSCRVLTMTGEVSVEELSPDSRLITRDKGAQPLLNVQRVTGALPMLELAISPLIAKKSDDTMPITHDTLVLVRDTRIISCFGLKEAFVRAEDIEPCESSDSSQDFWELNFGSAQVLYVNDLEIGTSFTEAEQQSRPVLTRNQAQLLF